MMATKRATKKTNKPEQRLIAYKGFDQSLICNPTGDKPFQYEIGKTYTTDTAIVRCAAGGFHSCEFPLDVFGYYAPGDSRYCEVEASGTIARDDSDTKIASAEITIKAELKIPDMVERAVHWILARVIDTKRESNTGDRSAATNTGDQSAATNTGYRSAATNTGDQSAATNTGDQSAATNTGNRSAATNTGNRSAATNTGYQSAATNTGNRSAATNTGNRSAATNTGYQSAATNTGYQSAATNTGDQSAATNTGDQSAATNTGDQSAATNTGYQSAATNTGYQSAATNTGDQSAATNTGDQSAATNTGYRSAAEVSGKASVAASLGIEGRARAGEGGAIVLCNRDPYTGEIRHIRASKVGENGIEPDVWYVLDDDGNFVKAEGR